MPIITLERASYLKHGFVFQQIGRFYGGPRPLGAAERTEGSHVNILLAGEGDQGCKLDGIL